jgi:hypothetical protein
MTTSQRFDECGFEGNTEAHTCELNLAEHYYKTSEKSGRDVAEMTNVAIRSTPIQIHIPEYRAKASNMKVNRGLRSRRNQRETLIGTSMLFLTLSS